jgi:predicted peptidase
MKSLILLLMFSLVSCGGSDNDSSPSIQEQVAASPAAGKVTFWSRPNGYDAAVFLPADYGVDPAKRYPLVLSLYGLGGSVLNPDHTDVGGSHSGFIAQVWDTALAATYPAIVIAPEVGVANSDERTFWNHDQLRELILDAQSAYAVDPDRVVSTGNSAGSLASQELALRSKDLLAGIMPGAFEAVIKLNLCSVEDLPIWSFGNTSDVIFQSGSWKETQTAIANCSNFSNEFRVDIFENTCGHGCWDEHWAKPEVQTWLHSQVRN